MDKFVIIQNIKDGFVTKKIPFIKFSILIFLDVFLINKL